MGEEMGGQLTLLIASVVTVAAWGLVFPVATEPLETVDIVLEMALFVTAAVAAAYVSRLGVSMLEVGWGLFTYSLLVDVLDEFTATPVLVDTTIEGLIRVGGLGLLALGLYRSQRTLQTDLERRNERLTVLNRILRHNVRNWVDVIRMRAELLREDGADVAEHTTVIEETARNIGRVTDKVRRLQTSLLAQDARTIDLVTIVEDRAGVVSRQFPDVEIETTLPDDAPVEAGELLEIAVDNLLENAAVHNTAAQPRLQLSVDAGGTDGPVVMSIADNGPGIPEEEIAVIESGTETQLRHGSGLGLWLANWVITEYGGTLAFENTAEGTVATVRLPAATA